MKQKAAPQRIPLQTIPPVSDHDPADTLTQGDPAQEDPQ